jgi:hypothetical protein
LLQDKRAKEVRQLVQHDLHDFFVVLQTLIVNILYR